MDTTTISPPPSATLADRSPPAGAAALLATATSLGTAAADRRAELDARCRIPAGLYRSVAEHGLFRQLVPADQNGLGVTPSTWFAAGVELARLEPSLGWVVTQGAVELGWIAAGADPAWSAEVLRDPLAASASTIAGVGRLHVDGRRARVEGRWRFNTGCQGATWIGGLALVSGDGAGTGTTPVTRWAWVPADRAEIVADWDTLGLRGTGSHTTVVPAQDIPLAWTFDPWQPTPHDRGAHRVLVGNGNWPIATAVAATQLGIAHRALDEAAAAVAAGAVTGDRAAPAPDLIGALTVAEAEARWHAAQAGILAELASLWAEASATGSLSVAQRIRLHGANVSAAALAVRLVDDACGVVGTAATRTGHPLERCTRDVRMLQHHIAIGRLAREHNARARLGAEPPTRLV